MENLTAEQLIGAFGVLLVAFGAIVTIDKVIDIFKKWRKPGNDTERKLAADKTRLDGHDRAIQSLTASNEVLCSGVLALLDHEIHNGNADQMQKARDDIMHYLQTNIANH